MTRYREEDKITYDNEVMYEIRSNIAVPDDDSDEFYNVKDGDSLRQIAFAFYNNARLYWVIAELNLILDPFAALEPGKLLRIPTLKRIEELVF